MREALDAKELRAALIQVCDAVVAARDQLCDLDAVAGDGDLGVTLARGFGSVRIVLDGGGAPTVSATLLAVGTELGRTAPSTLGSLLAASFKKCASDVQGVEFVDSVAFVRILRCASAVVRTRGGVERGERTVVDAMEAAIAAAQEVVDQGLPTTLQAAARGAEAGAAATADMPPVVGRAAWIGDRVRGTPDAGAVAWALILRTLADAA